MSDLRPRSRSIDGIARHGRPRPSRPALTLAKFVAEAIAVVAVSAASVAGIAVTQITSNIKTWPCPDRSRAHCRTSDRSRTASTS